jgi:hypothetical protein
LIDWRFFNKFNKDNSKEYSSKVNILQQSLFISSSPLNINKYESDSYFLNYNEFDIHTEIVREKIKEYRITNIDLKSILKVKLYLTK